MTLLITNVFPVEVWENIIYNCDGKTLRNLNRTTLEFKNIIGILDKNFNIWRKICHEEITQHELADIRHVLGNVEPRWKSIYDIWYKWNNVQEWQFNIIKMPRSYIMVSDLKTSGVMIIVADKTGFTIINSCTEERKRYKIGPVKHIELFRKLKVKKPKGSKFKHDVLDCTVESDFHFFFEIVPYLSPVNRYGFDSEKLMLPSGLTTEEPVIEVNVFYHKMLVVTNTLIKQVTTDQRLILSEVDHEWCGARCWFLWHACLFFCAKDETLSIFLDGQMKTMLFGGFPRVSAIFYFINILLLGTVHGLLYIYRINVDDIMKLEFDKYLMKIYVCHSPVVAINITEIGCSKNTNIIVATESRVYKLLPQIRLHHEESSVRIM